MVLTLCINLSAACMSSLDLSNLTPLELQQLTQNLLDGSTSEHPLISDIMPLSVLRAEYERGSGSFVRQIDYLEKLGFKGVRRARGDGDCFYRCESDKFGCD